MSILDSNEHGDIISWLPHGRGFIIRDKRRLADEVLPKYFKESKYTSFTRRLNRWNFTIQTHGHKEASYFHPMFIRGDPQRSLEMHPTPQSSNKARETRYIDDNKPMQMDLMNPPPPGSVVGNQAVPGYDAGNGMRPGASYPAVTNSLARADVSAQIMAAGAAAGGDPYADSRSNSSMPALPQSQMALNMSGANPSLPQVQAVNMQPQYYGQSVTGMNPMYGTQAHQRTNLTRDMMYNPMAMDRSGMPRDYQSQNNMLMLHPQLGASAPMLPHQMQYGDMPSQYIPTTPAAHAHFQARFGDHQFQQLRANAQGTFANAPFAAGNPYSQPTPGTDQKKKTEGKEKATSSKEKAKPADAVQEAKESEDKKTSGLKTADKKNDAAKPGQNKPVDNKDDKVKNISETESKRIKPDSEKSATSKDKNITNDEDVVDKSGGGDALSTDENIDSKDVDGSKKTGQPSSKKHTSSERQSDSEPLAKKAKTADSSS